MPWVVFLRVRHSFHPLQTLLCAPFCYCYCYYKSGLNLIYVVAWQQLHGSSVRMTLFFLGSFPLPAISACLSQLRTVAYAACHCHCGPLGHALQCHRSDLPQLQEGVVR
jgi:hypothetical protein